MDIICAHWTRTTRKFVMPLLRALTSLGHTVRIFGSQPLDVLRNAETDLYITTSTELKHAVQENKEWLLEQTGKPYVTLWFQTPLRNLSTLKNLTSPLHRAMFIPDSSDVAELKKLGFRNVFLFPMSWWVDTSYFKPSPPVEQYRHDVAWDCTFSPLQTVLKKYRQQYPEGAVRKIIDNALSAFQSRIGEYVSPFDFLTRTTDLDIWSPEFQSVQDKLFFLQKSMEREYILRMLLLKGIPLHIYGGFSLDHNSKNYNHLVKAPDGVYIHDYIDTFQELPKLYASSRILLSRMMYPSGTHDRLFCAAALKGFVLSEWKDDAAEAFEPGKEIIMYHDLHEMPELIKYYLSHENERRQVTEAAHRRFLSAHTPLHRARELAETLKGLL